jgi:hypothetical protein
MSSIINHTKTQRELLIEEIIRNTRNTPIAESFEDPWEKEPYSGDYEYDDYSDEYGYYSGDDIY